MLHAILHVIHDESLHTSCHLIKLSEKALFARFCHTCDCRACARILFTDYISILCPHALHHLKDLDIARDTCKA
jgi:hypothetical protein